jgi:hypothetical protein
MKHSPNRLCLITSANLTKIDLDFVKKHWNASQLLEGGGYQRLGPSCYCFKKILTV